MEKNEKNEKNVRDHLTSAKEELKGASKEAIANAKTGMSGRMEETKEKVNGAVRNAAEKVLDEVAEIEPEAR